MFYNPYIDKDGRRTQPTVQQPKSLNLPKEYVDLAQKHISELKLMNNKITSTKLRNIFGLFADLYNQLLRADGKELTDDMIAVLRSARVRIVYECGRDNATKTFVEKTNILEYLQSIDKSREKFICFYHYMEALVAYGRYEGLTNDR